MMRALTLAELELPLAGRLLGADQAFSSVSTDTRSAKPGELFVALRGERYDGHDYLEGLEVEGISAALVSRRADVGMSQLLVEDSQCALGKLGAYNRDLYRGPLVAITGSSGKTTVKNMVHAILCQTGDTLATEGNFNNEIGVPLTLLRLQPAVDYAVVEMGAAKAGDIKWLCSLARPTIALLLNAMPAHLEGFGSVDDVATAKGEIFDALGQEEIAVINADQPWTRQWRKRAGDARVIDFGVEQPAAVSARDICSRGLQGVSFTATTPAGDMAMRLALPGVHNVANALAAIAVGLACDAPLTTIRDGLESLCPVSGRLHVTTAASGAALVDDCYNANPGSVRAAIDMLAACPGRRTLVLGAMKELGDRSAELHEEIGAYAARAGIEQLWGVGAELQATVTSFGQGGHFFDDRGAMIEQLQGRFDADDTVLVKGSRSAGMEIVLQALRAQGG